MWIDLNLIEWQDESEIPELPDSDLPPGILPTEIRKLVERRKQVSVLRFPKIFYLSCYGFFAVLCWPGLFFPFFILAFWNLSTSKQIFCFLTCGLFNVFLLVISLYHVSWLVFKTQHQSSFFLMHFAPHLGLNSASVKCFVLFRKKLLSMPDNVFALKKSCMAGRNIGIKNLFYRFYFCAVLPCCF